MKIGILTYHFAINYGAVLQCYALQQTLHEMGYDDVQIINYNTYNWRLLLQNLPHRLSFEFFNKAYIKFRHYNSADRVFRTFVDNNLCCTSKVNMSSLPELANKYDAIIVGSDQVWAPRMRKDHPYFLNWMPAYKGKRIAYAPCCMTKEIKKNQVEMLREALNEFSYLSVRDIETQSFVYSLTGKKTELMPDPTILYEFKELMSQHPIISEPYILAYILGDDIQGTNEKAIENLRSLYPNASVYTITLSKTNPVNTAWADKVVYDASPADWLNMINNAQVVYTDSFHAAIFSLKFHTPFYAYYSMPSRKSRFYDLIKRFGLKENIISHADDIHNHPTVLNCDTQFSQMKQIGIKFLHNSL